MKCLLDAWQLHEQQIFNWLLKHTKNRQETEDIMQDVFLKAMRIPTQFCGLDDAKPWLFKMVKNHYIDSIRKQIASEEIDRELAESTPSDEAVVQLQRCIPRTLLKLSAKDRDIIERCDLNGMTQAEYAQLHDLSLPATKSRLQRARKTLKTLLVTHCNVKQEHGQVASFKSQYHSNE